MKRSENSQIPGLDQKTLLLPPVWLFKKTIINISISCSQYMKMLILAFDVVHTTLWGTAKLNPQISPRRVRDMLYPIFCFQQAFWLNIRHSMSPLKNIYIFRRIFLRQKLKNRAKIEKSVKIKNWQMNFFGFFFSFFG